ncbi:hypothetical protein [Micromonospora rubida]|uniref:hypothetical protein n=1 Tax=Micromonospora rubida TaxID=2697657 RepID=UPI001F18F4C7|nr:hypothetical protein [Micromonospora rubida]
MRLPAAWGRPRTVEEGGTEPARSPGLLRDPDFRRLFAATALGQLGDRTVFLAVPLVALIALDATASRSVR